MFIRLAKSAAIMAAACALSAAAGAATIFNFSFSAPWIFSFPASTGTGSGQLYANDLGNGLYQVYDVVGIAKETGSSQAATLNSIGAINQTTPIITGSTTTGFTINAIQLTGGDTYNFSRNMFGSAFTVSNGMRMSTSGTFTVSLAPVSVPIPEPASWMMMIVGFGAIGAMLRAAKAQPAGRPSPPSLSAPAASA